MDRGDHATAVTRGVVSCFSSAGKELGWAMAAEIRTRGTVHVRRCRTALPSTAAVVASGSAVGIIRVLYNGAENAASVEIGAVEEFNRKSGRDRSWARAPTEVGRETDKHGTKPLEVVVTSTF